MRGHRIRVALVLGMLAKGTAEEAIPAEYPKADVRACIAYRAKSAPAPRSVEPTLTG